MSKKITFGEFLKNKRLNSRFGLREFARQIKMKPSNYCSIESNSLPAPPEVKLKHIADKLALNTDERRKLFDLAAKTKDDIPIDLKDLIRKNDLIPAMLRTVEDKEIGANQIKQIVEDIKTGRYRKEL